MVSAFTDATFTFETDPAFSFEMILRWTINVRPMEGEDTKQSHFFSKNTCELDILLTRTVNIYTTNELVKLMML